MARLEILITLLLTTSCCLVLLNRSTLNVVDLPELISSNERGPDGAKPVVLLDDSDRGTSFRSDLAHPYGSMRQADSEFANPFNMRERAVNPAPLHPYNNGHRPKAVLHREFEHNPYGNHLPWESGPAGALAKDVKRPDRSYSYCESMFIGSFALLFQLIKIFIQAPRISLCGES